MPDEAADQLDERWRLWCRAPFKGQHASVAIEPVTCDYMAAMIAAAETLACIRHAVGRSGIRRSTVNLGLTDSHGRFQSARHGCLLPSGSLVDAALLVVAGGVKGAAGIA